jgi:SulP family sulfate permease
MVRRSGLDEQLGQDRLLFNTRTAIDRFKAMAAASSGSGQTRP